MMRYRPLVAASLCGTAFVCCFLAGCGISKMGAGNKAAAELATINPDRKPKLDQSDRTNLALVREGHFLRVGDEADAAMDLFPRSLAPDSYVTDDVPRVFPSPPYSARAWDSPSGEGFGIIVYNKQVAAGIWNRVFQEEAKADEVIKQYKDETPYPATPTFGYNGLSYTFWEAKGQQRLMIFKQPRAKGQWQLTLALGDDVVMDALGMTTKAAWHDLDVLKRAQTSAEKPAAPASGVKR